MKVTALLLAILLNLAMAAGALAQEHPEVPPLNPGGNGQPLHEGRPPQAPGKKSPSTRELLLEHLREGWSTIVGSDKEDIRAKEQEVIAALDRECPDAKKAWAGRSLTNVERQSLLRAFPQAAKRPNRDGLGRYGTEQAQRAPAGPMDPWINLSPAYREEFRDLLPDKMTPGQACRLRKAIADWQRPLIDIRGQIALMETQLGVFGSRMSDPFLELITALASSQRLKDLRPPPGEFIAMPFLEAGDMDVVGILSMEIFPHLAALVDQAAPTDPHSTMRTLGKDPSGSVGTILLRASSLADLARTHSQTELSRGLEALGGQLAAMIEQCPPGAGGHFGKENAGNDRTIDNADDNARRCTLSLFRQSKAEGTSERQLRSTR